MAAIDPDTTAEAIIAFSQGLRRVHLALADYESACASRDEALKKVNSTQKLLTKYQRDLAALLLAMNPGPDFPQLLSALGAKNAG